MIRGVSLQLTAQQRANRALYLGGLANSTVLDDSIRNRAAPMCVDGYYLLHEHNGGKDPLAVDPFDRWSYVGKDGKTYEGRTADCIGGASWCGGFDRYQPARFGHIYDGWINTDSMMLDARGKAKCFQLLDRPELGCFLTGPTGSPNFEGCGHITTVIAVPAEWDPDELDCWNKVLTVDVAARTHVGHAIRANAQRTAGLWFKARKTVSRTKLFSGFIRPLI